MAAIAENDMGLTSMLHCTIVLNLLYFTLSLYWGEVPKTREIVQLSYDEKDGVNLKVNVHSQSLGRLILDARTNREAVVAGAKRYYVTHDSQEQHELNTACHYRGSIRDKPQFSVLLSTCSGRVRASLVDDTDRWYIVYDKGNYVMFSDKELPNPYEVVSAEYNGVELNHTSPPRFLRQNSVFKRDTSTEGVKVAHKTVEVVVVTDRSFWQQFDTRIEEVEEFALATIARMDQIYKPYGVRIALVGMENWRIADLITVTSSYSATLRNFTMYRQEKLLNVYKQHDVSILMTAVDFDGPVIGYAGVDTMCRSSCASVNFNSRQDAIFYASVISHELGHNFGMYHDSDECVCPPDESVECLMSSSMGQAVWRFSNCSQLVLDSFSGNCLNNQPKTLYGDPVCGNGFVEEGEECDCGTEEECIASDPCCEPIGCKLKPGAECYSGDCCEECQFVSYKRVCRPASSECDLVEFCTGTNSQCPTNRYNQDGTECGAGAGFCNYGSCQTRDGQCTSLWGEGVQVSDEDCYNRYNRKGEWYGNCGSLGRTKYLACLDKDVLCGKLYCEVPEGRTTNLRNVYRSDLDYNETYQCTLAARPRAANSDNQDIAMVYDGTKCGDSEWCLAGQCVSFEKVPCPAPGGVECGGFGRCNDLNQCHCNAGYDPEFNCSVLLQVAGWNLKTILLAVMIIVLVVIPACIVTLLLCRRYNPRVKEFFDDHTQIRFSMRLPSLSRRPSYLRRNSRRNTDSTSKTSNGKSTVKSGAAKNPPPRPVKLPSVSSNEPPARPPGCYLTSSGWTSSSYNPGGGSRPSSTSGVPPPRPPPISQEHDVWNSVSVTYKPESPASQEVDQSANYVPLNMHPVRPAPARPAPSRPASAAARPSSQSYDSPSKRLAGSPLRDILTKR
ncbi:hypothetical protein ACHWQZ_G008105 [Mnemiopsis leidyi]